MPQKFVLEITLGNEEMQNSVQLRDALIRVVNAFSYDAPIADVHGKVRDINGNIVGRYEVI
jgi:hypothetical protein